MNDCVVRFCEKSGWLMTQGQSKNVLEVTGLIQALGDGARLAGRVLTFEMLK